ncbi:MAG TPA: hypothetical protein VFW71_08655 [Actinomycetota bacterium]|nr:hypothetical protein [Actinomycetota bacterium]
MREQRFVLIAGLATAVLLAACSKGGTSAGSTTGAPAPSGTGDAAALQAAAQAAAGSTGTTFKAVYSSSESGSSSSPESITVEQKPPKSRFDAAGGSVISDGSKTDYCSTTNGVQACYSSPGVSPVASLAQIFSPTNAAQFFRAASAALASAGAGQSVKVTHETFAGQSATCANVSSTDGSGKYCVLANGVLAAVSDGGSSFQLTNYSTSPPDTDFVLPAASPLPSGVG